MPRARPGYRCVTLYLAPEDERHFAELAQALGLPSGTGWGKRALLRGLTGAIVAAGRIASKSAGAAPIAARIAAGLPRMAEPPDLSCR